MNVLAGPRWAHTLTWIRDHRAHAAPAAVAITCTTAAALRADVAAVAICLAGLILTAWIYTLTFQVQSLRDDLDAATDDADRAVRLAEKLTNQWAETPTAARPR